MGQQLAAMLGFQLAEEQFGRVEKIAQDIASALNRLAPDAIITFRLWGADLTAIEGEHLIMNLKNNQKVHGKLVFKSAQGGVAAIQAGSVVFEGTAPDHFTVTSPDPTIEGAGEDSFLVAGNPASPSDDTAVGLVKCTFDGDAGDGVKTREAQLAVNVVPADAEIGELEVGEPEDL